MGRILAIDFGKKRTGIAVTDELQLSINGLPTLGTDMLIDFLKTYVNQEPVETILIGWPTHTDGSTTYLKEDLEKLEKKLKEIDDSIELVRVDESYSSVEAKSIILAQGIKKKKRRDKALTDKVSAMVILQRYLMNRN